jgi:hypothetical protein
VKFFFFDIFAIHSSSRHEKCCQMSVRLFSLFQGSIYQQWGVKAPIAPVLNTPLTFIVLFLKIS